MAIARALSHKPGVILADEPTGNLDGANQASIMDILVKSAKEDNKCVIISTHSSEVAEMTDEVFKIVKFLRVLY